MLTWPDVPMQRFNHPAKADSFLVGGCLVDSGTTGGTASGGNSAGRAAHHAEVMGYQRAGRRMELAA
jgi:hypothetical protein